MVNILVIYLNFKLFLFEIYKFKLNSEFILKLFLELLQTVYKVMQIVISGATFKGAK